MFIIASLYRELFSLNIGNNEMRSRHINPVVFFVCLSTLPFLSSCGGRAENSDPKNTARFIAPKLYTVGAARSGSTPSSASSVAEQISIHSTGPVKSLDLYHAANAAVSWYPSIQEAFIRISQQESAVMEARTGYLPKLEMAGSIGALNTGSAAPNAYIALNTTQMIYDFGKVASQVNIAESGVAGRHAQMSMAVESVAHETAVALIEVLRHQKLLNVLNQQLLDINSLYRLIQARANRGGSPHADLLQAQVRKQAAEAMLVAVRDQLAHWSEVLRQLTRVNFKSLSSALPSWTENACLSNKIDWAKLPVIRRQRAERDAANAQLNLAKAEGHPTLSLATGVKAESNDIGQDDVVYTVGLKLSGNLYDGGVGRARRNMATQALKALEAGEAKIKTETERQLQDIAAQLTGKRKAKQSLQMRQATMVKARHIFQKQYLELGTRTLIELLNSDRELSSARLESVNIEFDIHKLNIDCALYGGEILNLLQIKHFYNQ